MKIFTTAQAEKILGRTRLRNYLAKHPEYQEQGLAIRVGGRWLLTQDGIDKLKDRPGPGRPKKKINIY